MARMDEVEKVITFSDFFCSIVEKSTGIVKFMTSLIFFLPDIRQVFFEQVAKVRQM